MLPQRNAMLTRVERTGGTVPGGYSDDYDRPATDPEAAGGEGDDLWNGKAGIYYLEQRERIRTAGGSDRITRRSLVLDPARPELSFQQGDRVTLTHAGTEKTGRVKTIEQRSMPGVRGSTRLTLEDT